MARPPKDPNPVASTGGVANAQGQAIFTADWNTLMDDYLGNTPALTLNKIPKMIGTNNLGDSSLSDNGTKILSSEDSQFGLLDATGDHTGSFQFGNGTSPTTVRVGVVGGTPRIQFNDAAGTNWQIDSSANLLRIY